MKKPQKPPRIGLYPASGSPVVVAILRVRSKWWHVIRIDQDSTVERGSWFHGAKLKMDSVTLNHDGTLMSYLATADSMWGWSGICRPPWLRCLIDSWEDMPSMAWPSFGFPGHRCIGYARQSRWRVDDEAIEEARTVLMAKPSRSRKYHRAYDIRDRRTRGPRIVAVGDAKVALRRIGYQLVQQDREGLWLHRMQGQGFTSIIGERKWSWVGEDGVVRIVPDHAWGDHDPDSLHSLSCCVDAAGRWWQATSGRITCDRITKRVAERVIDIDTTEWIPPQRIKPITSKKDDDFLAKDPRLGGIILHEPADAPLQPDDWPGADITVPSKLS